MNEVKAENPEYSNKYVHPGTVSSFRSKSYKYIKSNNTNNLFSLPDETEDVVDNKAGIVAEFKMKIKEWEANHKSIAISDEEVIYDEETRNRLKDLGYIIE